MSACANKKPKSLVQKLAANTKLTPEKKVSGYKTTPEAHVHSQKLFFRVEAKQI
jgi:hypothetical protein